VGAIAPASRRERRIHAPPTSKAETFAARSCRHDEAERTAPVATARTIASRSRSDDRDGDRRRAMNVATATSGAAIRGRSARRGRSCIHFASVVPAPTSNPAIASDGSSRTAAPIALGAS
jgi:hypothetical protein